MNTAGSGDAWLSVRLGDVVVQRRERANPQEHPEVPFVGLEHVEPHSMRLLGAGLGADAKSSAGRFAPGDVLYSRLRPYLNKVVRVDFSGLCSGEFIVLEPTAAIDADFLALRLNAMDFVRFAGTLDTGDRPRVKFGQIAEFEFLLPPDDVQKRLVSQLERRRSVLEGAVAELALVRRQLHQLRASLYQRVLRGAFVSAPAAEEIAEYIELIRESRRRSWETLNPRKTYKAPAEPRITGRAFARDTHVVSLDELTDGSRASAYGVLQPGPDVEGGVPLVRIGDISRRRVAPVDALKKIDPAIAEGYERTRLVGRELLVSIVGTIGRVAVAGEHLENANVARAVAVFPLSADVDPDYVSIVLSAPEAKHDLVHTANEVARKTLNLADLRAFPIPITTLAQQRAIAEEVAVIEAVLDDCEEEIQNQSARAYDLTQEITRRAFGGCDSVAVGTENGHDTRAGAYS